MANTKTKVYFPIYRETWRIAKELKEEYPESNMARIINDAIKRHKEYLNEERRKENN